MPHQPEATLSFTEYELQVLAAFAKHAMEAGAISPDMFQVANGVLDQVNAARSGLVIQRRRIAINRAQDGTTNVASVTVKEVRAPEGSADADGESGA